MRMTIMRRKPAAATRQRHIVRLSTVASLSLAAFGSAAFSPSTLTTTTTTRPLFFTGTSLLFSTDSSTTPTTLITFDVDGTLVQGSGDAARHGVHAQAFHHAMQTLDSSNHDKKAESIPNIADALPRRLYHGSTDGLILLRYAQAVHGLSPDQVLPQLDDLMQGMYDFVMTQTDEAIREHLTALPGVLETLTRLQTMPHVQCGLVTGNVEGIARRKMKAVGIYETDGLWKAAPSQRPWPGTDHISFLGGFGSDYCSGNIDDLSRNHLDRAEQIQIAARRCIEGWNDEEEESSLLTKVVHVGDAPADVLAAKSVALQAKPNHYCVGMVAVATGSYGADELQALCGAPIPGQWEPLVLPDGMKDTDAFFEACGISEL